MNEKEYEQLLALGEKRNEKLYEWLRWLLLLAAGSLAVLVSLHGDKPFSGLPGIMMKCAWVLLAVLAWTCKIVLVLSETVLVLVIESRQS